MSEEEEWSMIIGNTIAWQCFDPIKKISDDPSSKKKSM